MLSRRGIKFIFSVAVPVVIVDAGLMYYNWARFGSVFDFGANYNLTSNDMTHRGWHWDRTGLGIFCYLLEPTKISVVFPFISIKNTWINYTSYMGRTIVEGTCGGVLYNCPILLLPFITAIKFRKYTNATMRRLIAYLCVSAILIVVVDTQMAGIVNRYVMDFSWLLCLAAIISMAEMETSTLVLPETKHIIRFVLQISILWQIVYSFFVTVGAYGRFDYPIKNFSGVYYKLMYIISFWL